MDTRIRIVVHNGTFHADDVFAVASLLRVLESKPVEVRVVRTRDEKMIEEADFVVDVGAVYNPERERFDHHQPGGAGERENGVPYAAFGLVWKKYGATIAGSVEAASFVDRVLVQPIDYGDNSGSPLSEFVPGVYPYTIDRIVSVFDKTFLEPERDTDEQFFKLVGFAKEIIIREVAEAHALAEARKYVEDAYSKSVDKRIVVLEKKTPWYHVIQDKPETLFIVFPDGDSGRWGVSAVRKGMYDFSNRKDFPFEWAGKRDEDLARVSGVDDAVFCHRRLFFAVAGSKEGALALAQKAV